MKFHSVQAQSRSDILLLNFASGFGSSLQLWPPWFEPALSGVHISAVFLQTASGPT